MFYHISYISRAAIPVSSLDEELNRIATKSSHKNHKANIFGCLIYRSGWFLQYLEGEKDTVTQLYELVKNDHRHLDVKTLSKGYQSKNLYSHWNSMQVISDPTETEIALEIIKEYTEAGHQALHSKESINAAVIAAFEHCSKRTGDQHS